MSSSNAVKPIKKTSSRTIKATAKMANQPLVADAPLSQQPAVRKSAGNENENIVCAVRRLNHDGAKEKASIKFANVPGHNFEKHAPEKTAGVGYEDAKKLESK